MGEVFILWPLCQGIKINERIIAHPLSPSISHLLEADEDLLCFSPVRSFPSEKTDVCKISHLLEQYNVMVETIFSRIALFGLFHLQ